MFLIKLQTNRQTDRQTNIQTDKQTNRQTDKQMHLYCNKCLGTPHCGGETNYNVLQCRQWALRDGMS